MKQSQNFVAADAARLPFAAATFACVIANHSLEHIKNLPDALPKSAACCSRMAAFT